MVRMRCALAGAAVLIAGWLLLLGYMAAWQAPAFYEKIGTAALDWGLVGVATAYYSQAADDRTRTLPHLDPEARTDALNDIAHDRLVAARILLSAGRPHAALSFAESAAEISPDNMEAEARVWRIRYLCGAKAGAKQRLGLLALRPDEPDALVALAACLADESRLESARALLEKALQTNPRCGVGWLELARVFRMQDDRTNALRAAIKAYQSADRQPSVRSEAAKAIIALGAKESGYVIGGHTLDYWQQAAAYWMVTHRALLMVAGLYVIFLF
ncbi:MAG: hypothetical protein ACLFWB_02620, partial [Armatimonadota bacterium]